MHYRIVQITKPYLAPLSYGGTPTEMPCYIVFKDKFNDPKDAHEGIAQLCTGKYPNDYPMQEDWFIVIQCF